MIQAKVFEKKITKYTLGKDDGTVGFSPIYTHFKLNLVKMHMKKDTKICVDLFLLRVTKFCINEALQISFQLKIS